ncbi:MAG TPA: hypothetical protein VIL69_04540 [Roseomonas sp.]
MWAALAADNLAIRDRFLAEIPVRSGAAVGTQAEARREQGRIFSVEHRGTQVYPAFQFRDGQPHPTIAKVLAALPEGFSDWQRAFWFVVSNGWLGRQEPIELLNDPEALVGAAMHAGDEFIG